MTKLFTQPNNCSFKKIRIYQYVYFSERVGSFFDHVFAELRVGQVTGTFDNLFLNISTRMWPSCRSSSQELRVGKETWDFVSGSQDSMVSSRAFSSLPTIISFEPRREKRMAVARPMPDEAPIVGHEQKNYSASIIRWYWQRRRAYRWLLKFCCLDSFFCSSFFLCCLY